MDIGINGIGGGINKKAAPIQFQSGAADCSGIGKNSTSFHAALVPLPASLMVPVKPLLSPVTE